MPYKANENRRHEIPKVRYRVENWAAYDAALRRRGYLTIRGRRLDAARHGAAWPAIALLRYCH